jgi:hypothetical protein
MRKKPSCVKRPLARAPAASVTAGQAHLMRLVGHAAIRARRIRSRHLELHAL